MDKLRDVSDDGDQDLVIGHMTSTNHLDIVLNIHQNCYIHESEQTEDFLSQENIFISETKKMKHITVCPTTKFQIFIGGKGFSQVKPQEQYSFKVLSLVQRSQYDNL